MGWDMGWDIIYLTRDNTKEHEEKGEGKRNEIVSMKED